MTFSLRHAEATEQSPRKPTNDDFFVAASELKLYVVCDGVSGHAGGAIASKLAGETVLQALRQKLAAAPQGLPIQTYAQLVRDAVFLANKTILDRANADPKLSRMATTLDLVWMIGDRLLSAHTGDGRVYLLRQGKLQRLTRDHTYVQELLDSGSINEEQAKTSPHAHALTQAVGIQEVVRVDLLAPEVQAGDRILLCSDGIYGGLSDAQLGQLMSSVDGDLGAMIQGLIRGAREGGSTDDATAIILDCMPPASISTSASGATQATATKTSTLAPTQPPRAPSAPLPQAKIHALDLSPCFGQLSFADKTRLLDIAKQRRLAPGEVLMREGELGDQLWVLISGKVRVSEKGVILAERSGAMTLGEAALMEQEPRSATVTALEECHVLEFERARLLAFLEPSMRNPAAQVYRAIATLEHQRMRDLSHRLAAAAGKT